MEKKIGFKIFSPVVPLLYSFSGLNAILGAIFQHSTDSFSFSPSKNDADCLIILINQNRACTRRAFKVSHT